MWVISRVEMPRKRLADADVLFIRDLSTFTCCTTETAQP